MGSGGRHEQLALGETPNIAARLQSLAAPDTVAISDTTYRLVQGYVRCDDLGLHSLRGVETPLQVYCVVGESAAQSRLDVVGATGLTPLVGREPEVGLLQERWAQSTDGLGQVVLLSGEAGIGKSRLVHVLTEHVVDAGAPRLTLRCSPYHTNSAFYPVIEHLQRLLQWHRDATPAVRLAALEQALQTANLPLVEVVPLLAALLAVPVPERYPPLTLSPQRQKQKTQEALVAWLLADAARQPVLAVWEDLHWADPSTLELLALLLDQVPTARLLLVLTCRPEFHPPWALRSYVTPLTLRPSRPSPNCWRNTIPRRALLSTPRTTGSGLGSALMRVRPMWKRSHTARRAWRSSRPSWRPQSVPSTNSRCVSLWAPHLLPPKAMEPQKWSRFSLGPGSYVRREGIRRNASRWW
jgi:hypothetical protein